VELNVPIYIFFILSLLSVRNGRHLVRQASPKLLDGIRRNLVLVSTQKFIGSINFDSY
jgi:hypothetical protein